MNIKTITDPRVRRTRRILRDALVSVILEKDYASISIKEITGRADVAYITSGLTQEPCERSVSAVADEGTRIANHA